MKQTKKKVGRPKTTVKERIEEKHFDLETIRLIAIHGLTDAELATILKVDERTITNWKKDEQFFSVLNKGKLNADLEVEKSLYKRANGFEFEETMVEGSGQDENGKMKVKTIKKTKKFIPPDTAAAFIWLKNRRGWRDRQDVVTHEGVKIIRDDI